MNGSERRRLLLIGKYRKPRCFPSDLTRLPVTYTNNKTAWMTSTIWIKWLTEWDRECRLSDRHICLVIDNCLAHPSNVELTNIRQVFFPPNTTSIQQPMDMGVIKNLKHHYRKYLNIRISTTMDCTNSTAQDVLKSFSLLDAIHLLDRAWKSVSSQTIENCFKKGGFKCEGEDIAIEKVVEDLPGESDQLAALEETLPTWGEPTDSELLEAVRPTTTSSIIADEDEDDIETVQSITIAQAMIHLSALRSFVQAAEIEEAYESIQNLEKALTDEFQRNRRQTRITEYFLMNCDAN